MLGKMSAITISLWAIMMKMPRYLKEYFYVRASFRL